MIAKHIPMQSARRSSFKELVAYITHAKDKQVRIGAVRVTNCHQDNALDAVNEVLATQLQNTVYHCLWFDKPKQQNAKRPFLQDIAAGQGQ